jgi:hypothetical protein
MADNEVKKKSSGLSPEETEAIKRNPPQILSEPQLAAWLDISPRSVRNLRRARAIPHVRLGGRVVYRLAEVIRSLEKLEVRAVV